MEWKPIETAPKGDEEYILVCSFAELTGYYQCDVVHWVDWDDERGWFNGDVRVDADHYTHWMPLPAPPIV
jgi:hypothetical protein